MKEWSGSLHGGEQESEKWGSIEVVGELGT